MLAWSFSQVHLHIPDVVEVVHVCAEGIAFHAVSTGNIVKKG
jgi:hypothetical protein